MDETDHYIKIWRQLGEPFDYNEVIKEFSSAKETPVFFNKALLLS